NGAGCVAYSSGMAALSAVYLGICRPGNNIVSSPKLYGGTLALQQRLAEFGIETRYAEFSKPEEVAACIDKDTVMLFSEPIANPCMDSYDFAAIYELAKSHGVLCVLDNTNTVALFQGLDWCDIEVISATKYIGGHGAAVGGLNVCKSFDISTPRFAKMDKP